MKRFASLKTIAIATAAAMAFTAPASAGGHHHGHHRHHHVKPGAALMLGIVGGVIEGAIEQEEAEKFERQCRRWYNRCEDGSDYACDRYYDRCE